MRVLNLYAGLGGNRKLWEGLDITAVEKSEKIAKIYSDLYPEDKLVIDDAHDYLLKNFENFDFIWSSPPCQSHSRMIRSGRNRKPRYPDMQLYEEIIFLKYNFEGKWVVENVKPYYGAFLEPTQIGRHLFWSNYKIEAEDVEKPKNFINLGTVAGSEKLKNWLGIQYEGNIYYEGNHDPSQVLRNCVHPNIGLDVFMSAYI
jgi:DNA (cytosine-5)-methyltransferase 1